jgi:NADP-reducing hydrogenase subunit HndD
LRKIIDEVWDAIYDPNKHVVVQTAPAVRIALGEELRLDVGRKSYRKNGFCS